ncbi:MAG: hypothetical protein MZV64_11070 [Ignavibacteriales bacterium]|nr:hypothetical protein [Ignavibacteriales bacterium]
MRAGSVRDDEPFHRQDDRSEDLPDEGLDPFIVPDPVRKRRTQCVIQLDEHPAPRIRKKVTVPERGKDSDFLGHRRPVTRRGDEAAAAPVIVAASAARILLEVRFDRQVRLHVEGQRIGVLLFGRDVPRPAGEAVLA